MPELLGRSLVSGTFLISSSVPGTPTVRIPVGARTPAQVSVKNRDAAAILYGKWVDIGNTNPGVTTADAGIALEPYESYTWDAPPAGSCLMLISTVNNSNAHVEGVWVMPEEAQL